jgi:hypothetical protein
MVHIRLRPSRRTQNALNIKLLARRKNLPAPQVLNPLGRRT